MGRSGTNLLWSSGETFLTVSLCESVQSGNVKKHVVMLWHMFLIHAFKYVFCHLYGQCYRDKPHEQLVLVSLTHYCASTPSLSTSWSRTTLQGDHVSGKSHLEASFPLRCFQRLSFPNLATRRCHWRDNRYTRGSSTPVLSY